MTFCDDIKRKRNALIMDQYPRIQELAAEWASSPEEYEDLCHEGVLGVIQATAKINDKYPFSTLAIYCAKVRMMAYVNSNQG